MASFGQMTHRSTLAELDIGRTKPRGDLLQFLSAQHVTQRSICELLAKLVIDPYRTGASQEAAAVLDYLTERLPVHAAIEEEHLLALLKRREIPGDDVDALFDFVHAGHQDSRLLGEELIEGLRDIIMGRRIRDVSVFIATANAFCYHQRALLEWKDSVLFPFARQRLHAQDLFDLAGAIARGRDNETYGPWSERAEAAMERYTSASGAIDLTRALNRRKLSKRQ